jgi:hypothetical protein
MNVGAFCFKNKNKMEKKVYNYYYVATSGSGGGVIESNFKIPIGGTFEYDRSIYVVTEIIDDFNFHIELA